MPVLANGVMQRLRSAGAVSDLTSALIGDTTGACGGVRAMSGRAARASRRPAPIGRRLEVWTGQRFGVQSRATSHGREAGFDSVLPADMASRPPKRGPPRTASETAPCPTGGTAHMGYRDTIRETAADARCELLDAAVVLGAHLDAPRRPRRRRDDRPSTVRVHGRTQVLPRIARSALRHHAR